MSVEPLRRLRRTANIAHSRHPVARFYRGWRYFMADSEDERDEGAVNALMLPLTLLGLTLLLVATIPGVGDTVAATCATICTP